MHDAYLQTLCKQAVQQLLFFMSRPQEDAIYDTLEKLIKEISHAAQKKGDVLIDTLTYGLQCQVDFIQNVALLHPETTENQWFMKKMQENIDLLDTMGSSLAERDIDLFNESAAKLIANNMSLEDFQINLVLTHKKTVLDSIDDNTYFYKTMALMNDCLSQNSTESNALFEILVSALFHVKKNVLKKESISTLWDHLTIISNPLASPTEKKTAFAEAEKVTQSLPPDVQAKQLQPNWYLLEMQQAEIREAESSSKRASQYSNLIEHESELTDTFLLFNTFKRSYSAGDPSAIAFSSFARACLLARNLAFVLPESGQKEAVSALQSMASGLVLFLHNRFGTADEVEKIERVKKASETMRKGYQTLITLTEKLKKSPIA